MKLSAPIQKVEQLLHFGILSFFYCCSLFRVNCGASKKIIISNVKGSHFKATPSSDKGRFSAGPFCFISSLTMKVPPPELISSLFSAAGWCWLSCTTSSSASDSESESPHLVIICFQILNNCLYYRLPPLPIQATKWINQINCQLLASKTTKQEREKAWTAPLPLSPYCVCKCEKLFEVYFAIFWPF